MISGKRFAGGGIPSIEGLVVLVSVIMTLGLAWVSGGYLLRAIRRKSRKEEIPLDWYTIPGRRLVFDAESSGFAAPTVAPRSRNDISSQKSPNISCNGESRRGSASGKLKWYTEVEVVTTFSSFRFSELSQPI